MSKDDSNQNEEVVSEINTASEEVAPKKKVAPKRTAAKKDAIYDVAANESLDAGENGRFEFSPDEEVEEKSNENSSEEKGIANEENKVSQNKHNSSGNNRQRNTNRGNDRSGKNNRSKRQIGNNKRNVKRSNSRWQKKGRGNSNELDLVEFDSYLAHESLKTFESIQSLHVAMESSEEVFDYDRLYSLDLNELRSELDSASIDSEGLNNRQSMIQAYLIRRLKRNKR